MAAPCRKARDQLSRHAPVARGMVRDSFRARTLGKREIKRLSRLFDDAEIKAQKVTKAAQDKARLAAEQILEQSSRMVEEIYLAARREIEELLAQLPDFDALEATPATGLRTAYGIIRRVADDYGLAMHAITSIQRKNKRAMQARARAVLAVSEGCPALSDEAIGKMFGPVAAREISRLKRVAGELRRAGEP